MARFKASRRLPLKPVILDAAWFSSTPFRLDVTYTPNDVGMDQTPQPNGGYFRLVIDGQPWACVFDTWLSSTVCRFWHSSVAPTTSGTIQQIKADPDCRNVTGSYIVPGPEIVWYP